MEGPATHMLAKGWLEQPPMASQGVAPQKGGWPKSPPFGLRVDSAIPDQISQSRGGSFRVVRSPPRANPICGHLGVAEPPPMANPQFFFFFLSSYAFWGGQNHSLAGHRGWLLGGHPHFFVKKKNSFIYLHIIEVFFFIIIFLILCGIESISIICDTWPRGNKDRCRHSKVGGVEVH